MRKTILLLLIIASHATFAVTNFTIIGSSFNDTDAVSFGSPQWIDVTISNGYNSLDSSNLYIFNDSSLSWGNTHIYKKLLLMRMGPDYQLEKVWVQGQPGHWDTISYDSTGFMALPFNSDGISKRMNFSMPINFPAGKFSINIEAQTQNSRHGILKYPTSATCHTTFTKTTNNDSAFFVSNSIGTNLQYTWAFGDSQSSTEQSPVHRYATSGAYKACVTINGDSACSASACDSVHITIANTNGIIEQHTALISTYPNPADVSITFRFSNAYNGELMIYDLNGNTISSYSLTQYQSSLTIQTTQLSSGIYYYRAYSGPAYMSSGLFIVK